jgi:hypothetical protein
VSYKQLIARATLLPKRGLKLYEYNQRVDQLNYLMHDMSLELENIIFWKHRGLQFPTVPVLDKRGVHLEPFLLENLLF